MTRLEKQLEFLLEIDKEKNILRQTHLTDHGRQENDAEHAWHIAIMIYLFKEYANEEFDLAKAMMMALIHDIVEIDAGDTFAYDEEAVSTQAEREAKAAERIFGILPEDQKAELKALFEEFEACETPEARIARVMDNLQPMLLNEANGGVDWAQKKITKSQIYKRCRNVPDGSAVLWDYIEKMVTENIERGMVKDI